MTITAWRITKQRHLRAAFSSGEGARKYGGRWNSSGTAIVYSAQSQALAALEILAHVDKADLLQSYVLIPVEIDESLIAEIPASRLPANWRDHPPPVAVRSIGNEWAASLNSVGLKVPSMMVPDEKNFLLNPFHGDFPKLKIGKPVPFRFDPRLTNR